MTTFWRDDPHRRGTLNFPPCCRLNTEEERRAEEFYQKALLYLGKGRSASLEAKKAGYRWLEEAASLRHPDATKLIGVSNDVTL